MEYFLYLNDVFFNHYFLIGAGFLIYLIYRIIIALYPSNNYMQTKYRVRGHTWRSIQCNKSIPYNIDVSTVAFLALKSSYTQLKKFKYYSAQVVES